MTYFNLMFLMYLKDKKSNALSAHAERIKRDEHANEFNLLSVFQESRISLLRIVEYYNFVREKTEKCEFDIISGQVDVIEADLTVLLAKFTWNNFGMCVRLCACVCLCLRM